MQRTCLWITAAIVTALAVFAVGDEAAAQTSLRGAYAFTGTGNCLVAPGAPGNTSTTPPTPPVPPGFDSSLQPFGPPLFSFSFAVEGIRTFNGDGTGTVTGTAVSTTSPNFKPNASSEDFTFHFTYVVNVDGSWTSDMVSGTYKGTFVTGPRSIPSQQTYTIDRLPTLSGLTGVNGLTLTAAGLTPSVETHTFSNGDVWPMICHRSRVFINLQQPPVCDTSAATATVAGCPSVPLL